MTTFPGRARSCWAGSSDMAIERRGAASTLQFDPVVVRLLAEQQSSAFIARLYGVLIDDASEDAARIGGGAFGRHRGGRRASSGRRRRRRHVAVRSYCGSRTA